MPISPRRVFTALALFTLCLAPPAAVAEDGDAAQADAAEMADGKPKVPTTKLGIELRPRVLVFTEPVREDGTIDYVAAFNKKYSEGVTKDNNAFRDLFILEDRRDPETGKWREGSEAYVEGVMKVLGLTKAGMNAGPHLIDWYDFSERHGIKDDAKWDVQEQYQYGPFDKGQGKVYAAWIKANEPALKKTVAALNKPKYWAPLIQDGEQDLVSVLFNGNLGASRRIARSLESWAYYLAVNGRHDESVKAIRAIRRLPVLVGQGPTLIDSLVAISIDALAAHAVMQMVAMELLPEEALAQIQKDWLSMPPRRALVETIYEGERVFGLSAFMQIATGKFETHEWLGIEGERLEQMSKQGKLDINHGLKTLSFSYRNYCKLMAVPDFAKRQALQKQYEERVEKEMAELRSKFLIEVEGILLPNPKAALLNPKERTEIVTKMFASLVMPAMGAAMRTETRADSKNLAVPALLGVARYRLKNGRLPKSLDELVPAYLPSVPKDPYDGEMMRYKPGEKGFKVYAVGDNLKDDGGITDYDTGDGEHDEILDWGLSLEWGDAR